MDRIWYRSVALLASGIVLLAAYGCHAGEEGAYGTEGPMVNVTHNEQAEKVEITVDGQPFTSYLYSADISVLKKPVLYPVYTTGGNAITRTYPLEAKAGERTDHPHHIGLWFNFGDVNGLDFWNNSDAITGDRVQRMGTIRHVSVDQVESGEGTGSLEATSHWLSPNNDVLLVEQTRYEFHAEPDVRIIDRITTLTAQDTVVTFTDNKEGTLGLRVTRALEMPADEPIEVTDDSGQEAAEPVLNNEGVSGQYANSEGIEGYPDVWGKQARWMTLSGNLDGESVTIAILDHPQNVGFPTHWHARDYGLFAANPLGRQVFNRDEELFQLTLNPEESTTFRHRIIVFTGSPTKDQIESRYQEWSQTS